MPKMMVMRDSQLNIIEDISCSANITIFKKLNLAEIDFSQSQNQKC